MLMTIKMSFCCLFFRILVTSLISKLCSLKSIFHTATDVDELNKKLNNYYYYSLSYGLLLLIFHFEDLISRKYMKAHEEFVVKFGITKHILSTLYLS